MTKETAEGLQGKINGARVFAGSYAYCQKQGIDCGMYELEAKRLARHGSDVLFVGVKAENSGGTCLGLVLVVAGSVTLLSKPIWPGSNRGVRWHRSRFDKRGRPSSHSLLSIRR
ncbi:hypothetical protein [Paenibacillus oleatilyticus]|uniref:Uncharacterized protein n=1 Tax=Paenibacillus oleatilyticus TaxID=2594886 RepID=A0ABV4V5B4_9BACL